MDRFFNVFCGEYDCAEDSSGVACVSGFWSFLSPSSCVGRGLIIGFDLVVVVVLLYGMFRRRSSKFVSRYEGLSRLEVHSGVINALVGVTYLGLGVWNFQEELRKSGGVLPLRLWLVDVAQGLAWLLVGVIGSLRVRSLPRKPLRLVAVLVFLFAGALCIVSILDSVSDKTVSASIALEGFALVGAALFLVCTFRGLKHREEEDPSDGSDLYTPLTGNGDEVDKTNDETRVTPFAKARVFSKMSFWWLNVMMKSGRVKPLENEDIPKLRWEDTAESGYASFLEELNKQKRKNPSSQPSILRTIVICNWREILVSGFFALLKILTVSAGPLLLNAFIEVASGKESFRYEGYVLAASLFLSKSLESLSQRQWYFRSRLIGMKVRSLLSAAIYRKQLRLSNSARLTHSGGEIMNYVTVDAYRIGEFPYWFHQTWTTSLQLCIALIILFKAVGLATIAALVVIVLTVLCNTPLAKLQHKFQSKLMAAQDERLKACSEALVNMKVLKLYAWEIHFKNIIESLRKVEYKWLSAVQLRKSYNGFLFWSSPVLVSTASFGACYLLEIPLYASNVFTFVATLRLVQDPIRSIPDVIAVVIQAKVSFERIVKFLEAPELQNSNFRQKSGFDRAGHSVMIKSADFSWEEDSKHPTLKNIDLEVKHGDKVAICGEVGSGKSTLLAAILGEVPNTRGTVCLMQPSYVLSFELRSLI